MSTLHGEHGEAQIGRGELRKPSDRTDQPGQRVGGLSGRSADDAEHNSRRGVPSVQQEMEALGVTRVDSARFCYGDYRYDNVDDALRYARADRSRAR